MADDLKGMRIAILATDGVERVELEQPRGALYGASASTDLLSTHSGEIQARQFDLISAGTLPVDRQVSDASAREYDGLLLPGGTVNPDTLRINSDAVGFVRDFVATGKPVAAICHGPWTLIEAGPACGPTCGWPARSRSTRQSSPTASSRRAVPRQICPISARQSSRTSPGPASERAWLLAHRAEKRRLAKIEVGDETPDFALPWAAKDIDLALAESGTTTLLVAAAISRRWHELVNAGLGQADVSAARHGLGQPQHASAG